MKENERVIVLDRDTETLIGYGTVIARTPTFTIRLDNGRIIQESDVIVCCISSESGRIKWKGCL